MPTLKTFFSGGLVLAYLLIGSGRYVVQTTPPDARQTAKEFAGTLPRKNYLYSVVPGGVNSPEELAEARRSDPVVAAHFADFGKNTRITTLQEDMYVYVSYRQGNKIFYTKRRHKVCKGEVVITDGKNFARARCANRLSRVFRPPALVFDEPSAPQFDYVDPPSSPDVTSDPLLSTNFYGFPQGQPYVPPVAPGQTGATPGPPSVGNLGQGPTPILPSPPPFAAGSPGGVIPSIITPPVQPPPVTTPEPNDWPFFLLAGLALPLYLAGKQKKRIL